MQEEAQEEEEEEQVLVHELETQEDDPEDLSDAAPSPHGCT